MKVQTNYGIVDVKQHPDGAFTIVGLEEEPSPLPDRLALGALCGSFACNGCYEIAPGVSFHPPRPGYDQKRLMEMDNETSK